MIAVCSQNHRYMGTHVSHTFTCHLAEVTFSPLSQPIKNGTQFTDPGGIQG